MLWEKKLKRPLLCNAFNRIEIQWHIKQLLRLSPGAALDLCSKLTMMLSDNVAWMSSMPAIKDKILQKKEEQDRQLAELLKKVAEKSSVEVNVGQGGTAQITESGIINQVPNLLE